MSSITGAIRRLVGDGDDPSTARPVQAVWNGEVLAESDRTVVLEGRHYFPPEDVAHERLEPNSGRSICFWKGRASYRSLDRAIAAGEAYGFAKLVADPHRRLVGATVAAPGAGEAIAELTAWISRRERLEAVSQTVHAYPTLAEGPARAADEHLAARYSAPGFRKAVRPLLATLRAVEGRR